MKLRAKILLLIASLMGILYVLVAAALLPEMAGPSVRKSRERGEAAAQMLATILELIPRDQRRLALAERREIFNVQPAPGEWSVCDGDDRVVGWSRPEAPPERLDEKQRDGMNIVRHIADPEGREAWTLYLAAPPPDLALERELWALFISMLVGTVMLGVAVYMLTLRLVINPVERLAAASRLVAGGHGILPKVPHSERTDEIGALVRSYNAMVDEVNDLRVNLERRVHEAVQNLEEAQKKLIVSERLSVSGRLAAGVAHEINNPLGGMLNAARSLQKKAEPGTRDAEYIEMIVEGLGRVQNIVSSMLRFARPTQERGRTDLAEVIDGALLFSKHRITSMNVEVVKEYPKPGETHAVITGNRAELGQVFLNLIVNALDAMAARESPRLLTVSAGLRDTRAFARVADTGLGMSEETRKKAGEFFFSTKAEGHGTGLGLAIVNHIVNEHGGTMEIESAEGKGSAFTVWLPAGEEGANVPASKQDARAGA
ncbi:MAG: HAMP domain-containing histidine kinase [Planctomycetes bacterium]|nr:HAMP domain-containing histidine kinase [Planctomycetota bacterium]